MTSLQRSVESVTVPWAVPAGAVVVTDAHGVVDEYYFGRRRPGGAEPVDEHTLFEIGSISKVVTGMVVLRLCERGLLSLDQPIGDILDWLAPSLRWEGITLERLLQHSAGILSGVEGLPDPLGQLSAATPAPGRVPGAAFHYSNFGFLLLGAAASWVGGDTLPGLARRLVLEPAGMDGAIAAITDSDRSRLAVGTQTVRPDRPWWPGDPLEAAPWLELDGADGNVAASGPQLAALGRLLLNGGEGVLSPESFAQQVGCTGPGGEPLLTLNGLEPSTRSRYGLGINTERRGTRTLFSHGGGMVGYASFLLVDPSAGRAVAVVTSANGDSPVAEAIARVVLDAAAPDLHPAHWKPSGTGRARAVEPGMVGTFGRLRVETADIDGAPGLVGVLDGVESPLRWGWGERIRSELPGTELHGLTYVDGTWASGDTVFGQDIAVTTAQNPYCGHFRSYTPWFSHFRVIERAGRLLLSVPGGVESPGEECELFPLGDGVFAIDAVDAPETLRFGGPVARLAQWADRDGCHYSRAFTP